MEVVFLFVFFVLTQKVVMNWEWVGNPKCKRTLFGGSTCRMSQSITLASSWFFVSLHPIHIARYILTLHPPTHLPFTVLLRYAVYIYGDVSCFTIICAHQAYRSPFSSIHFFFSVIKLCRWRMHAKIKGPITTEEVLPASDSLSSWTCDDVVSDRDSLKWSCPGRLI